MKKVKYNILMLCFLGWAAFACSDDLATDESLAEVGYELPQGEEGSLEALIYDVYERYGTYVLYDFDRLACPAPRILSSRTDRRFLILSYST